MLYILYMPGSQKLFRGRPNGPKSTQDKFKGELISGQLPTDLDILSNKFNSVNLNEQF